MGVPIRLILKEIGGRMQNASGSIDSDSNMYKGASGKAPSDKLLGGGNKNPVMGANDSKSGAVGAEGEETPENTNEELEGAGATSDKEVKTNIQPVGVASQETHYTPSGGSSISGILKNLELDPAKAKKSGGGAGGAAGAGKAAGAMGGGAEGEAAEGAGDAAGDAAGDMGDIAGDAASAM